MTAVATVVLAPDLMDRSRIAAVLPSARFVGVAAALSAAVEETGASLALVDLARQGALDAVSALRGRGGVRVIGFGSHVDETLLAAATAAGADEVLARSVFFRRLASFAGEAGTPEG